jgi:hypothetical protein
MSASTEGSGDSMNDILLSRRKVEALRRWGWKNPDGSEIPDVRFHRAPEDKYILMLDDVVNVTNTGQGRGKLETKPWGEMFGKGGSKTFGRQLADALGRGTRTSLDKDFTKAGLSAEMNTDGDDFASYEPTESLTWKPPLVDAVGQLIDPEIIETVVLSKNGGPARSYVENVRPPSNPAGVAMLPANFEDKALGIKGTTADGTPQGRIDVFVLRAELQMIEDFDAQDVGEPGEARDVRMAIYRARRFSKARTPADIGLGDYQVPAQHWKRVLARGVEKSTPKKVRMQRERLKALGVL